jgi:hypothetical protein
MYNGVKKANHPYYALSSLFSSALLPSIGTFYRNITEKLYSSPSSSKKSN